jgi:hypothetical protein
MGTAGMSVTVALRHMRASCSDDGPDGTLVRQKDARVVAMCDYLKDLTPVTSEKEFFPRFSETMEYVSGMVRSQRS